MKNILFACLITWKVRRWNVSTWFKLKVHWLSNLSWWFCSVNHSLWSRATVLVIRSVKTSGVVVTSFWFYMETFHLWSFSLGFMFWTFITVSCNSEFSGWCVFHLQPAISFGHLFLKIFLIIWNDNNFISGFLLTFCYIKELWHFTFDSLSTYLILIKHSRYSSVSKTALTTLAADRDLSVDIKTA